MTKNININTIRNTSCLTGLKLQGFLKEENIMPPKFKFTKEKIIDVCFEMARKDGIKAITARGVAAALGSSAKVIFGLFDDMDDLRRNVIEKAKALYKSYIEEGMKEELAFKGTGRYYIKFAQNEPKLFQMLFMNESARLTDIGNALNSLDESFDKILDCVVTTYGLSRDEALDLYKCAYISAHGMAVLSATGVCEFSEEEINDILGKVALGVFYRIKCQQGGNKGVVPSETK